MSKMQNTSSMASTLNSPLNRSLAKAAYSFPRDPKKPLHSKPKQDGKYPSDVMYELPSMLSKRSASIGYGKKSSILLPNFSPSPTVYENQTIFDKKSKKGHSFGISREDFKAISIYDRSNSPGPGFYEDKINKVKESARCSSMRSRDGFPEIFKPNSNPGPGQYQIKQYTDKQFFFDSKRQSPKIYSIRKSNKENFIKLSPLGPTSYETGLNSMGKQVLGSKKTERSFFFDKQIRETLEIAKSNVGPGSYEHYSQFGK